MFLWFIAHQTTYSWIACTCFVLLVALGVLPLVSTGIREKIPALLHSDGFFLGAMLLSLVALRWPPLYFPNELNSDESQVLAGALTLEHRPIFWESVNGTTSGPLNFYALFILRALGFPFSYFSARLTGLLLVSLTLVVSFRVLAREGRSTSRMGIMPMFCLFAFTTHEDFLHYSSEHVSLILLALGLGGISVLRPPSAVHYSRLYPLTGAFALGASPFAKLQVAPIAATALVAGCIFLVTKSSDFWRTRIKATLALATAGALPSMMVGGAALVLGVGQDAWKSYILQNVIYAADKRPLFGGMYADFWSFTADYGAIHPFLAGGALFIGVTIPFFLCFKARDRYLIALYAACTAAAWYAAIAPGKPFGHYLLLLVVPAGLLFGTLWNAWWNQEHVLLGIRRSRAIATTAFFSLCLLPQIAHRTTKSSFANSLEYVERNQPEPTAQTIIRYTRPGESLGLWGWMPRFFVETQLVQATREAHSYFQIVPSPLTPYFRKTYLEDFIRNAPPVFVDAVGHGNFHFTNRKVAHESFPELADYVRTNYTFIADIHGSRIYVRNERLAAYEKISTTP